MKDMKKQMAYVNDEEPTPYRKKKNKKAPKKSDHKHRYIHVLYKYHGRYYPGTYCPECGKISNWSVLPIAPDEVGNQKCIEIPFDFDFFKDKYFID